MAAFKQVRDFRVRVESLGLCHEYGSPEEFVDHCMRTINSINKPSRNDEIRTETENKAVEINRDFETKFLDYPNAKLTNSYKSNISLSDIFIPLPVERREDVDEPDSEPAQKNTTQSRLLKKENRITITCSLVMKNREKPRF